MKKLINLIFNREMILYMVFGAGTTAVDFVTYWFCSTVLGVPNVPSTVIALFFSILFAFLTNRKWVFQEHEEGTRAFFVQMAAFYAARLFSGLVSVVFMWWTVDVMHWNNLAMKLLVNIVVIIMNYVASKFLIFRKRTKAAPDSFTDPQN